MSGKVLPGNSVKVREPGGSGIEKQLLLGSVGELSVGDKAFM